MIIPPVHGAPTTAFGANRLPPAVRRDRAAGAMTLLGLLGIAAVLPAARPLPIDLCLVHRLTGLPCLTCGLIRSVCALMRGDLAAGFTFHPAGVLVVALVLAHAAWMGWEAARGLASCRRTVDRATVVLAIGGAVVSALFWVIRLADA